MTLTHVIRAGALASVAIFLARDAYAAAAALGAITAIEMWSARRPGTPGGGQTPQSRSEVYICAKWSYWRHPLALLCVASIASATASATALDSSAGQSTIVGSWALLTLVHGEIHRMIWAESGARWTEERWDDPKGRGVRQLVIDASPVVDSAITRLAIRTHDDGTVDVWITWITNARRWPVDRHSSAGNREVAVWAEAGCAETGPQGGPTSDGAWRNGARCSIAHAPQPTELARRIAARGGLIVRRLPPFATPAHFKCASTGERRTLKRFIDAAEARGRATRTDAQAHND